MCGYRSIFLSVLVSVLPLNMLNVCRCPSPHTATECQDPLNACYLELVSLFRTSHLPQVLGFKFQAFKDDATPKSLYTVTAALLASGRLVLEDIAAHLSPTVEAVQASFAAVTAAVMGEVTGFGVIGFTATGGVLSCARIWVLSSDACRFRVYQPHCNPCVFPRAASPVQTGGICRCCLHSCNVIPIATASTA